MHVSLLASSGLYMNAKANVLYEAMLRRLFFSSAEEMKVRTLHSELDLLLLELLWAGHNAGVKTRVLRSHSLNNQRPIENLRNPAAVKEYC